ncbi:MAG: class I SAM-dependent methyltransferase, partial [Myxococcota bacterium]
WPWALAIAAAYAAFKLILYFITEIVAIRMAVWRAFYAVFDRLLAWSGHANFDTMNWGFSNGAPKPVEHPREVHLALYRKVIGDAAKEGALLEVGSGRGGGAFHLAELGYESVTGLDLSQKHVELCRRRAKQSDAVRMRFVQGSADAMPVDDETFDVVLNVESSHCYPDFDRFLDECYRVLRPGGTLRWCDFRTCEEWDALRSHFATHACWEIAEEEDMTAGVVAASERLTPWYREKLRVVRWLVPLYETLHNFGCLVGSRNYQKLEEREWIYGRLALIKR